MKIWTASELEHLGGSLREILVTQTNIIAHSEDVTFGYGQGGQEHLNKRIWHEAVGMARRHVEDITALF